MSTSSSFTVASHVPLRAGAGLKAEHYRVILDTTPTIGFFEVHAENYMGAGGPPHRFLSAIRERYPLSLHGVGLSIGADTPLDIEHLQRLKALIARYEPGLFSEHLAWSSHSGRFFNDLLPVPYTERTLDLIANHIDQIQETLGRQMLLENPSTYIAFDDSAYSETDFIAAIAHRTGCGLLLDINNVYVASVNHQWDPFEYIDAFPLKDVSQFHLAGHGRDQDALGRPLLIDTHDCHVASIVWALYSHALRKTGPKPTLIEWDANVPNWPTLYGEAQRTDALLQACSQGQPRAQAMRHSGSGMSADPSTIAATTSRLKAQTL